MDMSPMLPVHEHTITHNPAVIDCAPSTGHCLLDSLAAPSKRIKICHCCMTRLKRWYSWHAGGCSSLFAGFGI